MAKPDAPRISFTFVVEVGGAPVVAFTATGQHEARALLREQWFRDDLREAHSHGTPVWDGKAKLAVRRANHAESVQFSASIQLVDDSSGDLILVYLVELDK
jgi:hypothetical protein